MKLGLLSLFVSTAAWAWPDLQVVKTGPALAAPGDVLTYTLAYSNNGGQKSTSVVLKDYLPNYVTVLTNTLVNGSVSGSTVTWSIGTLYSGSQGSRSFQVRVTTNAFFGLSLTNRAQITGKEAEETGKTNNNTSILVTLITNRPPVAQDDFYILTEKTTLTVPAPGILGNDSDPEASALTTVLVNPPAHGTLTLNPNGGFIYQPADDFVGLDNFTYRANDGYANSGVATVTLSVQPCYPAVDVMLVIDRSSSMKGQPYDDARRACSNFVQNLKFAPTADQAGLASYNSSATLDQKLTNNLQLLKQSINSIPAANGYTSITLGLQTAQNELLSARHNPEALPVILLLSDGLPTGTDSPSNALFAAAQAKGAGTRIFTVGLGGVDHALMSGIASYPGDYFYTTNSSDLTDLFNAISTIICRPPTNIFTIGPSNLIVCPGDHATFTVAASGCDAFTYQWTKGGSPLAGQTNNSLLIPNVSATNAGVYGVEVRSNCKSVTNSATLTVRSNVTAMGPFSQTNCTGGSATFTTTAGGTGPYTYQWLRNGSVIPGQTGATLMLNSISTNDSANYGVVVSGVCGAPVTNSASLTVNPPPAISAPGDRTVNSGTPWTFGTPTANYPIVVVSTTTNNLCGDALIAQRTWQTTDPCGNVAQATQTVTVLDRTPPVITCPANLVLPANDGVCSRSNVTFTVTATDNCGVTNLTTVPPSGSTFPVGVTTVTSTATDASGNQSTCIFTVTINDAQNPTISCPPLVTVIANNGSCAATNVTLGTPAVNDNCGVASITNNAPAIFPVGTNFITWTAKDNAGNSASCVQTVIVTDNQIPTISCPLLVTVVANNGSCAATNVILGTPTVNDNCGVASITNNAPAIFPVGTNFVTWTVKDNAGNSASCVQTLIVTDNQLPTISCPPLVTVIANNGSCSATNVVLGTPTASDNCGVASITNNAPAIFPVGTNFVTWTVKDNSGNSASCVQTVIIRDNQLPTITCPPLVIVIANNGACTATNLMLGTPTVSDNCGVASITNNAPAIFPVGTNFVTWTVKDNSGNSASCVQTVIVRDNQLPTITCPTLVTVIANNGSCAATNVILGTPTVNDNCGVASVTNNAPAIFPVGTNFVTWTVKDNSGNTASCVQTVIVRDNQLPTITCPPLVTLIANNGGCSATNVVLGTPTVSDNCGIASITNNAPAIFPVGTNFVTWTVKDNAGNSASCVQTVIVTDNQLPTISCPPLVTVIANNGACSATNVVFGTPTVSDNCGIASITNNAPAMFPVGTNFVTWTVKDNSGNSASCVQTVIIRDNQLPTITCPPLVTVIANNGACTATNLMLGTPTVSDNCGVASITNNAPAIFPVGTNFVTWTVKDNAGNSASCVQTVIIRDNQLPTISCPPLVTVVANNGSCAATNVILGTPTVNDNCGVASVTNNAPAIFPVGTNFVTWTVKDNAGNSASCVQTVVITDGQPPQISCPQIQNRIVEAGMPWAFDTVTVTDNCGTPALSVTTVTNLGCGHTFTAVRTWRATDSSGNAAECTQTVSVLDTTAPVVSITSPTNGAMFIAPADFTVLADAQDTNGGIARVEFFASTNRFGEATNGAPYFAVTSGVPAGTYVLTARATDACGNMRTSAPVSINVIDRPPLTVVRSMRLNPATSLYEIRVRVTNPTYSFFDAVRVLVEGLPPTIQVYNPSGTTNGVPYVETQFAVTPDGTSVEFVIEFYTTSGVVPNPTFRPQLISANRPGGTAALFGTAQPLHRALMLPNRTFLIEFPSLSNRVYYVQYSTNLTDWKTAQPAIAGSGNWYQWLDGGLPKTDSPPATTPKRFYRLILLP